MLRDELWSLVSLGLSPNNLQTEWKSDTFRKRSDEFEFQNRLPGVTPLLMNSFVGVYFSYILSNISKVRCKFDSAGVTAVM